MIRVSLRGPTSTPAKEPSVTHRIHLPRRRRKQALIVVAAQAAMGASVLAVCVPARAGVTDASWLGGQSGQWTDPTRWTTNPFYPDDGTPPGSLYHAWITAPAATAPFTVDLGAPVRVQILTLDAPTATLAHGGGTLSAVTLAGVNAGTFQVGAGATFESANVTTLSAA